VDERPRDTRSEKKRMKRKLRINKKGVKKNEIKELAMIE
jgi:hypothetical protein